MGEVIEFKPRSGPNVTVTLEEVDEQLLLECAITQMWEELGGMEIETDKFLYHVWFMQFCDICFTSMEHDLFSVNKDGEIHINSDLVNKLRESIHEFKIKSTTNDNSPNGSN